METYMISCRIVDMSETQYFSPYPDPDEPAVKGYKREDDKVEGGIFRYFSRHSKEHRYQEKNHEMIVKIERKEK